MSAAPKIAPYGSWSSPITAEQIASGSIGLGQIALDARDIYWSEMRPAESGRYVIVRLRDGVTTDVLPAPFSARTRVHEYGGGAFTVADGVIYFSNDGDQRLYRLPPEGAPQPITPQDSRRYADAVIDLRRQRIVCVCEDHRAGGEPVNTIVAVNLDGRGEPVNLVSGHDFYASPRLSPDGAQLAWLAWNHPDMPWDGTELWLADIASNGSLSNPRRVAGSRDESVFQPAFAPDGTLYFVSDRSRWWNLYRFRSGQIEALAPMEAEFGQPQWVFGMSTYAFASARHIVCAFNREATWRLARLDTGTRRMDIIETPFTDIGAVVADHGKAVFVAASPTMLPAVVRLDLTTRRHEILRSSSTAAPDAGYLAAPQALTYPVSGRRTGACVLLSAREP